MNAADLYQEIILDHSQHPRNFGRLEEADVTVPAENPVCGDEITLQLKVRDRMVEDARFTGSGCAICMASASLMTRAIRRHPAADACLLFDKFHKAVNGEGETGDGLGDLAALAGVRNFPQRVKCAMLPWQALRKALQCDGKADGA